MRDTVKTRRTDDTNAKIQRYLAGATFEKLVVEENLLLLSFAKRLDENTCAETHLTIIEPGWVGDKESWQLAIEKNISIGDSITGALPYLASHLPLLLEDEISAACIDSHMCLKLKIADTEITIPGISAKMWKDSYKIEFSIKSTEIIRMESSGTLLL